MGMEAFGPAGEHIGRSPDWPKGVEDVLRHRSRAYWQWVNGNERAYYDGDIRTVNELLDLYSRVDLAEHPVVIRPGRPSANSFHGKLTPYVVEFDVPEGISLHHARKHAKRRTLLDAAEDDHPPGCRAGRASRRVEDTQECDAA